LKGLCYQGFVECFTTLARLNFDESTYLQSLKTMIYYCKYFLQDDLPRANIINSCTNFYSLELNETNGNGSGSILKPITKNLIYQITRVEELKAKSSKMLILMRQQQHKYTTVKLISSSTSSITTNHQIIDGKKTKKTIFPIFFQTT
jgi:hypothetical protein